MKNRDFMYEKFELLIFDKFRFWNIFAGNWAKIILTKLKKFKIIKKRRKAMQKNAYFKQKALFNEFEEYSK